MLFYIAALIIVPFEIAFLNHLQFFSVRPNLILFLATIFCFYFNFDRLKVILFCLFCGFLKDTFSIVPFGTYMLIFICTGITLSYISQRFLRYNWKFIIPLFVLATVLEGIFYFFVQDIFFDNKLSFFTMLWRILIPEMLYGLLVFFIFFRPIKKCVLDKLS